MISVQKAHPVADHGGGAAHLWGDLAEQRPVKPVGGTGDAECRDDRTGVVSHRCGDRVETVFEFLDRAGIPIPSSFFDLFVELIERSDGVRGEPGQPCAVQQLPSFLGFHEGQQDLAGGGGVQRAKFADPVMRADRRGSARLVDIDDKMRSPHRDIDRFAQLCCESFAH